MAKSSDRITLFLHKLSTLLPNINFLSEKLTYPNLSRQGTCYIVSTLRDNIVVGSRVGCAFLCKYMSHDMASDVGLY